MKRILLTGATGFIGRVLATRLLDEGERVRTLVRDPEHLDRSIRNRAEIVVGDIRRAEDVTRAMQGVDVVLHLAALAKAWGSASEFWAVNVRAVGHLLRAAHASGVERFVHTSSVLGLPPFKPAPIGGSAARPTLYEETKQAAEELIQAHAGSRMQCVIVRPTRVYGPGPLSDANGVTKMIDLYLRGRFRLRLQDGDVLSNYVHVADVADGMIRAARFGGQQGDYLLGGGNASLREFLDIVTRLSGTRRRVLAIPRELGMAIGGAGEIWGSMGGNPSLTRGWIRVFLEDRRVASTRANRELGYTPRSLETGLRETIAWLQGRTALDEDAIGWRGRLKNEARP